MYQEQLIVSTLSSVQNSNTPTTWTIGLGRPVQGMPAGAPPMAPMPVYSFTTTDKAVADAFPMDKAVTVTIEPAASATSAAPAPAAS